jgi:hypothetical protein
MNPTNEFTHSMEHRHWMACHDLGALSPADEKEMRAAIQEVLPPSEREHWVLVCYKYDNNDMPKWFRDYVSEEFGV